MTQGNGSEKLWVITRMMEEVNAIVPSDFPPTRETGEGFKLIGALPMELRKLWSLGMKYRRQAKLMALEADFLVPKSDEWKQLAIRTEECTQKADALAKLFWLGVHDYFDTYVQDDPETCFYVCTDWSIYLGPDEDMIAANAAKKSLQGLLDLIQNAPTKLGQISRPGRPKVGEA